MTCKCPPWQCYFRADCRRPSRRTIRENIPEPGLVARSNAAFFEARRAELVEELSAPEIEGLPARRAAVRGAITLLDEVLARKR